MRIVIITMDDPVHTRDFIKYIIDNNRGFIVGLAQSKGNRLKIGKRSKVVYLLSLFIIMGPLEFLKNSSITFMDKIKKILSKFGFCKNPSIYNYALSLGIESFEIESPNDTTFIEKLKELKPDVVINQSQHILKKEFLQIPVKGTINRHNALLPKNRGRLTPFWVLFKKEKETGVSIHFVTEGIDSGDIIVQEKFGVNQNDTFGSIVKKNYRIAPLAMLKAIQKLENNENSFIKNDSEKATYNTIPTLSQAIRYRISMSFK